jgi:hypothetical protein
MAEPTDPAARAFAEAVEAVVNRLVHVQTVTKSELQQVDERTGYRESVDERFLARDVLAVAAPILLSAKDEEITRLREARARIAELEADRDRWRVVADEMAQVFRDLAETKGLLPAYRANGPADEGPVGVTNSTRSISLAVLAGYETIKAGS